MSDFLILQRAGFSVPQALGANVVCSLATILGVITFMVILAGSDEANVTNAG